MKPFSLEEYLANPSRKIITRDGRNVRIICTDAKSKYPIVALIKNPHNNTEYPSLFTKKGKYASDMQYPDDLFFAPEKHKGWINVYKCKSGFFTLGIYPDKEHAEERAGTNCVATVKIEWEE